MIITTNDKCKTVLLWLDNDEKSDPALRESLKPVFREWKAKGYLPVVMLSGAGDLKTNTQYLMKHGLKKAAKAEIAAEKAGQNLAAREIALNR